MSFHVETIPNKRGRDTILLRQAWRQGKRIRRRTIANLTDMPPELVRGFDAVVRGGAVFADIADAFAIRRARPHGHAAAAMAAAAATGLPKILHRSRSRVRDLALGAILARLLAADSKLATARRLSASTADSSLGPMLGLGEVSGNEVLDMLDWLLMRQRWIEKSLANRHLKGGSTLVLYDVTSSYLEGKCCPLAAFGHNRDGKKGKMQIVYGLLCAANGCPVAVEVFAGNTADPATVARQVDKIRARFGIARLALVGDRGMITTAGIGADLEPAGLDWISALKASDLGKLVTAAKDAAPALDVAALAGDAVAEITSPDFPGERLMVCLNPRLRQERARKRQDLIAATEESLRQIAAAAARAKAGPANRDRSNRRVGRDANRRKVAKYFHIEVGEDGMSWSRNAARIEAEARLDGIYAIRTSLDRSAIGADDAVRAYKNLKWVERAFRVAKSRLDIRPVHVYTADHVRAHVFLCMLAWYLEWHMRRKLAPLLFEDDDRDGAEAQQVSPVAKAAVSDSARAKADSKRTADGLPVHSFPTLLADLATLTVNEVSLPGKPEATVPMLAEPTALQARALELLGARPEQFVSSAMTG